MNNIIVNNTDRQLNISVNGVLDVYSFTSIKSVSRGLDIDGNYYIAINFKSNDKNNSLRIPLEQVTSPAGWTNDVAGADQAIADIRGWMGVEIGVEISEANDSILVYGNDGINNQPIRTNSSGNLVIAEFERNHNILRTTASGTIAAGSFSASFASVGTADATVGGVALKPGETVNFDAGAVNNILDAITYDATTAGAELLIIHIT
jgi:hypothetical protein